VTASEPGRCADLILAGIRRTVPYDPAKRADDRSALGYRPRVFSEHAGEELSSASAPQARELGAVPEEGFVRLSIDGSCIGRRRPTGDPGPASMLQTALPPSACAGTSNWSSAGVSRSRAGFTELNVLRISDVGVGADLQRAD
jgi:hypothetical protein